MIMSYEEFLEDVVKELNDAGYRVILQTQVKCNVERMCFHVKLDEELGMMIPAYDYWTAYADDEEDFDDIIKVLISVIEASKANVPDVSNAYKSLDSYEAVREKLFIRIVSTERNKKWLEDVPHKEVCDLSISYAVQLENGGVVAVTNDMLERWKVTLDQLNEDAMVSTERIKPIVSASIYDVMAGNSVVSELSALGPSSDTCILSCKDRCLGAAVIFYEGVLNDIAMLLEDNYYILPSSIHEVLIVPARLVNNIEDLKRMVHDVNESDAVEEDDLLSYSVYFYDGTELTIA